MVVYRHQKQLMTCISLNAKCSLKKSCSITCNSEIQSSKGSEVISPKICSVNYVWTSLFLCSYFVVLLFIFCFFPGYKVVHWSCHSFCHAFFACSVFGNRLRLRFSKVCELNFIAVHNGHVTSRDKALSTEQILSSSQVWTCLTVTDKALLFINFMEKKIFEMCIFVVAVAYMLWTMS